MAKPDRLTYLALGGAGEIGMNMYLYGYGPEGAERSRFAQCRSSRFPVLTEIRSTMFRVTRFFRRS